MIRFLAGALATQGLRGLAALPTDAIWYLGLPFLPAYALFRGDLRRRLAALRSHSTCPIPSVGAYYQMRLRLAALSVGHLSGKSGEEPVRIEGTEHFQSALASGKPVALLGWHQGPVELLHHLPHGLSQDHPWFLLATAGFAPPLSRFLREGRGRFGKVLLEPGGSGLRNWVRTKGVLAAMIDQVPGNPGEYLSFWNGLCRIPFPRRLFDFIGAHNAVSLPISVHLVNQKVEFRFHPPLPTHDPIEELRLLMERQMEKFPAQYNWSYPKIRTK